jgi:predicted ferric reductase
MRRLPRPGDIALMVLLLLPLAVALPRLGGLGGPPELWLTWIGRVTGILGLALMLLAAAVSLRLPGFDRPFGGLVRLWKLHHWMGFGAFILAMVHVLALALAAVPASLDAAVATLFPSVSHGAVWLGWLAWLAMVIFLAPTFGFFGRLHYQRWKRLHLVSAAALLLGLGHALPLAGETWPWWLLGIAGVGAIVWRKLLSPRLSRLAYRVAAVELLARGVVELVLEPEDRRMSHGTGQFVYLSPLDESLSVGRGEEHPYTIASSPHDDRLRIGIKDLGDASHALQSLTPGSRVLIEGPYGDFFQRHSPSRKPLWFGGGIGITPFVGAAREMAESGQGEDVQLLYLANSPDRAYYQEELEEIAEQLESFTYTSHYYRDLGPLTEAFLRRHCPDYAEREIYICGPPAMNAHLQRLLTDQGIPASRIHSEVFDFL